jgi:predicted transcriptional regulator
MEFENNIQEWVSFDNKIKEYNIEVKKLREQKNSLTERIMEHVENNNMNHNIVNITDGQLRFQTTKVTPPLTFSFITECLNNCISDEEQVKQLILYFKENRKYKYVSDVKRTYSN